MTAELIVHPACATLLSKPRRKEGTFGTLRLFPYAQKLEDLTDAQRDGPLN
jgi:hypothetical protein